MKTIGFLGGDARMAYLANLLAADGCEVRSWSLPGAANESRPSEAMAAERIVLPVPLQKDGRLNGTRVPLGELWPRLNASQRIYAGAVSAEARRQAEQLGLRVVDYCADEALAVRNAVPTAEGALALAIEHTDGTIMGSRVLICGYGRIGKILSERFRLLGADVFVSARRPEALSWISAFGMKPLKTGELYYTELDFDIIVNTVPHMIIDRRLISRVKNGCVIIDLASLPGGVDLDAAKEMGIKALRALSLPGKTAPSAAGRIILSTIENMLDETEMSK